MSRGPKPVLDVKLRDRIVSRYEAGMTLRNIGLAVALSEARVRRVLQEEKVLRERVPGAARLADPALCAEVVKRYEAGQTYNMITFGLGVDAKEIKEMLRRAGVEVRRRRPEWYYTGVARP